MEGIRGGVEEGFAKEIADVSWRDAICRHENLDFSVVPLFQTLIRMPILFPCSVLTEKQLLANIKTSKGPRHLPSGEKMQGNYTRLRN